MIKQKITGIVIGVFTICILAGCLIGPTMGAPSVEELTEDEKKAFEARGQYRFGENLYSLGKYGDAAIAFGKALAYDPNYRAEWEGYWTPEIASDFGISISDNLEFSDFSLFFFQGVMYYNVYAGNELNENDTLEKALAAFQRGYEIDIEGGKSADKNLKIVYLGYIANFLEHLGRVDEAEASFRELAKAATLTEEKAGRYNIE